METEPGAPVSELVRARTSWRTFDGNPLDAGTLGRLRAFCETPGPPPFGTRCRFAVLDAENGRVSGTYGVARGARHVLVGVAGPGEKNLEDFAWLFERILLFATHLDLGTCWMGGTVNRKLYGGRAGIAPDEVLPAISPVGRRAGSRGMVDRVFRVGAGSKKRKDWGELFFDGAWGNGLAPEQAGPHAECLENVRLGPSASNKQPWRIVRDAGAWHLFLLPTPGYGRIGGPVRLQRLDMGIAMCHFALTAAEAGLAGAWSAGPSPAVPGLPDTAEYVATWRG